MRLYGMTLRRAHLEDVPRLKRLHRRSLYTLAADVYTRAQIDGLFATLETADAALVARGTYFVAEAGGALAGSGGWTTVAPAWDPDPAPEAREAGPTATIRAVFVDPGFTRRGIARRIMELAETDALLRGRARTIELVATLTGVPLYRALGYRPGATVNVPLANGEVFPAVRMAKRLDDEPDAGADDTAALSAA